MFEVILNYTLKIKAVIVFVTIVIINENENAFFISSWSH